MPQEKPETSFGYLVGGLLVGLLFIRPTTRSSAELYAWLCEESRLEGQEVQDGQVGARVNSAAVSPKYSIALWTVVNWKRVQKVPARLRPVLH
jgi:hypothetical protein